MKRTYRNCKKEVFLQGVVVIFLIWWIMGLILGVYEIILHVIETDKKLTML